MVEPIDSLAANNTGNVKPYLDWLLAGMNQYAGQIRRTTVQALLLMAVFAIVVESGKAITWSGFKVQKGSLVITFVPALVAYLFLQLISDTNKLISLRNKFSKGFKLWNNDSAASDDLSRLVLPPFPLMWGASIGSHSESMGWFEKAGWLLVRVVDKVAPFIGLVFEGLAYYVLFEQPIFPYLAWFLSAIISFVLLIFATFAYFV